MGKLTPPQTLLSAMPRHALLDSLRAQPPAPLLLLVAPAGYGKTTLMMQWREQLLDPSRDAPVAWLSLDEADAEPNRFLAYVILALHRAGVALGHLPRLAEAQALDADTQRTVSALLQALALSDRRATLLIDDYHTVACGEIDRIVQVLLEQAAPWLQWVLSTRTRPHLPLARWKARGWVHELGARELRLSLEETHTILGNGVAHQDLLHLHHSTEGWAVAVQLARLWRAGGDGSLYGLRTFSGCAIDMAEYLAQQIVDSLPAECTSFLLDTSLLERFDAKLADTVRGRDDSARLLIQLSPLDALLVPLDGERHWFRYHALLQDFLRPRVDGERARAIHRAAAQWLALASDWVLAVSHALRADDTALAVQLVVRAGGWALVLHHGIRYAQGLVDQFDEPTRRRDPDLLLLQCYLHAKLGDHLRSAHLLQLARDAIDTDPRLLRDFHVVRTLSLGYVDRFEQDPTPALPGGDGHADQPLAVATLQCVQALAAQTRGELVTALVTIRSAHARMHAADSARGENYCRIHEAQVLALAGRIEQSRQLVEDALQFAEHRFGMDSSLRALVGCCKAQHHYWQGEWALSVPWLQDARSSLEQIDGWLDMVAATGEVTWRVALRAKGLSAAMHELAHLDELATRRDWHRLSRLVASWRIDLLVQCGRLPEAHAEALAGNLEDIASQRDDWRNHEAANVAMARLQLAAGASGAAHRRLHQHAALLRDRGLLLPAWRLQLLAAVAAKAHGSLSLDDVGLALAPVVQERLPGLLLEIGPCLLPVLESNPHALPDAAPIMTRLRGWRAHPLRAAASLSVKERQVLRLLAAGQSNKSIARALEISENTVKFHLKHLYATLDVDNRTAAVSTALRQGLLEPSH